MDVVDPRPAEPLSAAIALAPSAPEEPSLPSGCPVEALAAERRNPRSPRPARCRPCLSGIRRPGSKIRVACHGTQGHQHRRDIGVLSEQRPRLLSHPHHASLQRRAKSGAEYMRRRSLATPPPGIYTYTMVAIKRTTTPTAAIVSPTRMAGGVNRRSSTLVRFASAKRAGEARFDGCGQGEAAIPRPIHARSATARPITTIR